MSKHDVNLYLTYLNIVEKYLIYLYTFFKVNEDDVLQAYLFILIFRRTMPVRRGLALSGYEPHIACSRANEEDFG